MPLNVCSHSSPSHLSWSTPRPPARVRQLPSLHSSSSSASSLSTRPESIQPAHLILRHHHSSYHRSTFQTSAKGKSRLFPTCQRRWCPLFSIASAAYLPATPPILVLKQAETIRQSLDGPCATDIDKVHFYPPSQHVVPSAISSVLD